MYQLGVMFGDRLRPKVDGIDVNGSAVYKIRVTASRSGAPLYVAGRPAAQGRGPVSLSRDRVSCGAVT